MGHARAILALPDEEQQRAAASKAIRQNLSVRRVERLVRRMLEPRPTLAASNAMLADPNVQNAISEMERVLGTRVRLAPKGGSAGKIEIEYYSEEDLNRIYETIVRP